VIDEGFIGRTYRTTAAVWAVGALLCLAAGRPLAALGLTIGSALGLLMLLMLDRTIRRTFVPGAVRPARRLLKMGLLKFLIVTSVVTAVIFTRRFDLVLAFCGGVGLTQAVMFLKALGILALERMNSREGVHCTGRE
jgi:hypothetical protein